MSLCNFADDNTITVSASSIGELNELMQINTIKCIEWFNHNHMTANKSKFQSLVASKQHTNIGEFVVNNEFKIKVSDTVTFLGVMSNGKFILMNSFILCHYNYCPLFSCFAARTVSRNWKSLTKQHYAWHCQIIPHLMMNYYKRLNLLPSTFIQLDN